MSAVEQLSNASIQHVLGMLAGGERRARRSFSFTPPENVLSPLARTPFVMDLQGRYFFDHMTKFGSWSFYGALEAGTVEQDVLLPMLREATGAEFVDVRPLSGLHCMTVAMAALCRQGDTVLTVPVEAGGHICTTPLATRLGMNVVPLPMLDSYGVDLEATAAILSERLPAAIYIDQSTQLFPIDPLPLREVVDACSPRTLIHYDASHLNGLILTGAMFNPLARGAHSLGGSTHKTLPGPHKGYLATSDPRLVSGFDETASTFVSHHHPADVVSLAITLIELRECGGAEYGRRVKDNARLFARELHGRGVAVAAADRGFTDCHQVWLSAAPAADAAEVAERFFASGIVVNKLDGLPGLSGDAFRFSLAEFTRLGAGDAEVEELVEAIVATIEGSAAPGRIAERMRGLRRQLDRPRYCYGAEQLEGIGAPPEVVELCAVIERQVAAGLAQ